MTGQWPAKHLTDMVTSHRLPPPIYMHHPQKALSSSPSSYLADTASSPFFVFFAPFFFFRFFLSNSVAAVPNCRCFGGMSEDLALHDKSGQQAGHREEVEQEVLPLKLSAHQVVIVPRVLAGTGLTGPLGRRRFLLGHLGDHVIQRVCGGVGKAVLPVYHSLVFIVFADDQEHSRVGVERASPIPFPYVKEGVVPEGSHTEARQAVLISTVPSDSIPAA